MSTIGDATEEDENRIKSWETYKILNKIKENVHQKRKVAKDVLVFLVYFELKVFSEI